MKCLLVIIAVLISYKVLGQNFEGRILYERKIFNPNPDLWSDTLWQNMIRSNLGNDGVWTQETIYKEGQYFSKLDLGELKGVEAFNPENRLIYIWREGSDSVRTIDSRYPSDELIEISYSEETDTVMGILCESIVLKTKRETWTIWYNTEYFKMNPKLYEGHGYKYWDQILQKTNAIPLKIESKSSITHETQTIIDYEEMTITDDQLIIPDFHVIR